MIRFFLPLIVLALFASALARPAAAGGPPRYLVLQPPTKLGYSAGYAQPLTAPTYNYGWFGAKPRSHTVKHRGYYGEHWEWRLR